ncbi:MAG: hypothetical protein AB1765_13115 [Candidatus Hydrogenedentota bacterium]
MSVTEIAKEITGKDKEDEAINLILRDVIIQKIREARDKIKEYETKYGMDYSSFEKRLKDSDFVRRIEQNGIIRTENDFFDWGAQVTELSYLEEKLREIGS